MKKYIPLFVFGLSAAAGKAQSLPPKYEALVKKADSLYSAKDYTGSAYAYSSAFKENGWKGTANDRYNAACSWALANEPDSAFFNLERIAVPGGYANYQHLQADTDLKALHADKRWQLLLDNVKQNKEKAEAHLNKPLVQQLDSIFVDDQGLRQQMIAVEKEHGWESPEMKVLIKKMTLSDSVNLVKVKAILDTKGWLGADEVGPQGNTTLFLVIQHSDLETQEKYLPMMREAVKKGKAKAGSLALMEDRVLLDKGKKQIYGSQVIRDPGTGNYFLLPLRDPDNVDKRRAAVGLVPLADYLKHWNMTWDPAAYKKELPSIEQKLKKTAIKP